MNLERTLDKRRWKVGE